MNNENNLIVQSNKLIDLKYKGDYIYSVNELKIICSLISNVEKDEEDFKTKCILVKDLHFGIEETKNYEYIIFLFKEIMKKPIQINKHQIINWFSSMKYNRGVIEYRFDKDLKPFLLDLKNNFTSYYLSNILRLNSQYSIILYELLKQTEKLSKTKIKQRKISTRKIERWS